MFKKLKNLLISVEFGAWPLFFLGIILVAQNAWVPGMFHDGNLYAAFGKNAALKGHWLIPHLSPVTYNLFTQHPPFIFILEGIFFKIFGSSFLTARLFICVFYILTLFVLYFFVATVDRRWAYFSLIPMLINPSLIKKVRFPNLDIPLMFFVLTGLFCFWLTRKEGANKNKYWFGVGIFFGLAMLTKGPVAAFLPIAIGIYFLLEKDFSALKSPKPWLALILSFVIFAMWLFALLLANQQSIFIEYLKSIFIHTALNARGQESPPWLYVVFLIKQCSLWILLLLGGMYFSWRKKEKFPSIYKLFFALFCAVLLPMSIAKFKYSHYIIPLYPALGVLSAFVLIKISEMAYIRLQKVFSFLVISFAMVLIIFPIGNTSSRDKEIFAIHDISKKLSEAPNALVIIDEVYPFFSAANLLSFISDTLVFSGHSGALIKFYRGENFQEDLHREEDQDPKIDLEKLNWSFLVPQKKFKELKDQNPEIVKKLCPIMFFRQKEMFYVVPCQMISEEVLLYSP